MGGPSQFVTRPVRKAVRKASIIVSELIINNLDQGTGSNVITSTLFRCGEVVGTTGAPGGEFVNDACTMVRFIFNGGCISMAPVDATVSIGTVFVVVARVENATNIISRFRIGDNELLTSAFSDSENIFYSGGFLVASPTTTSATRVHVPIIIDMKAKRKLNTGDAIVMFCFTRTDAGTANADVKVAGVSTVIAI